MDSGKPKTKSTSLVLFDKYMNERTLMVYDDLFEEKRDTLMTGIISPYNYSFNDESEEKVRDFYLELFKDYGEIPTFEDVMCVVTNYNWSIMNKIAEMDFYTNHYAEILSRNRVTFLPDKDRAKLIAELTDQLWEGLYYDFFAELEQYTMEILDYDDNSYEYSKSDAMFDYFSRPHDDVRLYKNDAQNIMFEGVHLEQLSFALEELTKGEVLKTTMVNG